MIEANDEGCGSSMESGTATVTPHSRSVFGTCAAIALALALIGSGCATLIKGRNAEVEVIGSGAPELSIADSARIPIRMRGDGSRYISLRSDTPWSILVRYDGRDDTLALRPELNNLWLAANLLPPAVPFGLGVDYLTGAWYGFGDAAIAYISDSLARQRQLRPGWQVVRRRDIEPEYGRREEHGVVLAGFLGVTFPVVQIPVAGNHYALEVGYRPLPYLDLMAAYEAQGCTDLTGYTSDVRVNTYVCNMTTQTIGLTARYYPLAWLYASAMVGRMAIQGKELLNEPANERYPGFSTHLPVAGIGAGFRAESFIIEYRQLFGLEQIQVREGSQGSVNFGTLRAGFNLRF